MKTFPCALAICFFAVSLISEDAVAQLSVSAQLRTRTEFSYGQGTPFSKGDDPSFFTSQRTRLNVGYKAYRTKFYVSAQDVRIWGQDASTNNRVSNTAMNGLMLHEAWSEISLFDTTKSNAGQDLILKIGRQELLYDDSRLLGNLDWLQQGRRHDAALLRYTNGKISVDLGAAYNQNRELRNGTLYDGVPNGYAAGTNGIGTMYKSMQFAHISTKFRMGTASFLIFKDDFQKFIPDETGAKTLEKGTWNRFTAGPHLQTKIGKHWNLTASGYAQTGKDKNGQKLSAYMYSVKGLYAANRFFSIGPGFDYTSGSVTGSKKNNSFDPLYGTPHKFWGQMDYFYAANGFGKGGLSDLFISSTIKFSDKFSLNADVHKFSSAAPITNENDQKLTGNLGTEIDLIGTYNLTKFVGWQAGYCMYFATNSLAYVKGIKNPQKTATWAYVTISIKPDFLK